MARGRTGSVMVLAALLVAALTGPAAADPTPTPPLSPGTAPPADGPVVTATTVTVMAATQSLLAGEKRTFSGVVGNGGTPLAGVQLSVVRKSGTTWTFVAHVTTDAAGRWSYEVAPVADTIWRTDFAGDDTFPAAQSPEYSASVVQVPSAARFASANAFIATRKPWAGWALYDQLLGRWYGSPTFAQVNNTESMVKVWIAADFMLGIQATGRTSLTAYERSLISRMIRVSDDQAAETVYQIRGRDNVIRRLIRTCGLTDTYIGKPSRWSWTKMSPRDAVRMGACVQPGRNLWPIYGNFLFGEMRAVAASNAFGIQQAYPAGNGVRIAVKNGWTAHGATNSWNVTCLGIWGPGNRWLLAIESRYLVRLGLAYGAATCQETTRRLFR